MRDLETQLAKHLDAGQKSDARYMLSVYAGPFVVETRPWRMEHVDEITKQLEAEKAAKRALEEKQGDKQPNDGKDSKRDDIPKNKQDDDPDEVSEADWLM